jgi:uncharacterized alpha/beta hydrolase family protein
MFGKKKMMTGKSLAATLAATVMGAVLATSACAEDGKMTMLQSYDWTKVPVLFVHGLWDSKATWNPMIHALERDSQISQKYQFWTFSYDTYQPFWVGAAGLQQRT